MAKIILSESKTGRASSSYTKAVAAYRKATGIADDIRITEDMIDSETLEAVALDHGMPSYRLKKRVMEDTTID